MPNRDLNERWLDEAVELHSRVERLEGFFKDALNKAKSLVVSKKFDKDGILHEMLEKHKIGPTSVNGDHMEFNVSGKVVIIDKVDDKTFSMKVGDNTVINFTSLADMEKHLDSVKAMKSGVTPGELVRYSRAVMRSQAKI